MTAELYLLCKVLLRVEVEEGMKELKSWRSKGCSWIVVGA